MPLEQYGIIVLMLTASLVCEFKKQKAYNAGLTLIASVCEFESRKLTTQALMVHSYTTNYYSVADPEASLEAQNILWFGCT